MTSSPEPRKPTVGGPYPADLGDEIVDVASIPGVIEPVDRSDPVLSNSWHASVAGAVLKEYVKHTGLDRDLFTTVIPDLIADLRHLCDALGEEQLEGYSFDDLARYSYIYYNPEVQDGFP